MNYFYEMKTGRKFQNNCLTLIFAQNWGKYRSTTVRNSTHFQDTTLNLEMHHFYEIKTGKKFKINCLTLIFNQNSGKYRRTTVRNSLILKTLRFQTPHLCYIYK